MTHDLSCADVHCAVKKLYRRTQSSATSFAHCCVLQATESMGKHTIRRRHHALMTISLRSLTSHKWL